MAETKKIYKYLDLSGYAFTGKHAVIDLMREFKGYCVPHYQFEFNLFRIQGGIRDLETALVDDWSPIRSDAAIRRFRKLVKRLGTKNNILDPKTWFNAVGWNYDNIYNGKFLKLSEEYVNNLLEASWTTNWPYPLAEISSGELFVRKIFQKVFRIDRALNFRVYLPNGNKFYDHTKEYINKLLSSNVPEDTTTIVMHNAFEPFNPMRAHKYFNSVKSIVVDRDPRDNYVAGLWYKPTALCPAEFVKRYRLYREIASRSDVDSRSVLKIQYESLITNYEKSILQIIDFLGEDVGTHINKRKYFNPDVSVKNIGIWRDYPNQDEIEFIKSSLSEYCVVLG